MELNNRILKIIEKSGLTPSEFADKIEVQRSAISHITSGRNKPSLEFLMKIKNSFPEIDTDWLIFGVEKLEILPEQTELDRTVNVIKNSEQNLNFSFSPSLFDEDVLTESKVNSTQENFDQTQNSLAENSTKISVSSQSPNKEISRIVIFYNDGTFDDFTNAK